MCCPMITYLCGEENAMCPSSLVWKEFAEDVADILIYCGRKAFRATQRAIIVAKSDVPDVRIDWNGGALV